MTDDLVQPDAVIRASSFAELFDCAHRWEGKQMLGMNMPSGAPALIGNGVHAGTAVFDQARLDGETPDINDAMDAARDAVRKPTQEVNWDGAKPGDAVDMAATLTLDYCNDIAPRFTYTKVEAACDVLDVRATNGVVIRFTGHVDRERVEGNQFGIVDFKTGKGIVDADGVVNTKQSGAQLATYELLGLMTAKETSAPNLLPALIIGLPTTAKRKPTIAPIYNPHKVLLGDAEHMGLIDHAAVKLKAGSFPGNPRSILCSKKYCPRYKSCWFRFQGE